MYNRVYEIDDEDRCPGTAERDPIFSWVDMLEIYLTSPSTS